MKLKVLIDKNVNYKLIQERVSSLKEEIEINGVNIEGKNSKLQEVPALAILGKAKFPMRLGGKDSVETFEGIKKIVEEKNLGDAMHLEVAIHDKYDFFVTNDKHVTKKRTKLKGVAPNLTIFTETQFVKFLEKQVEKDED